jgi:hypothetical protein
VLRLDHPKESPMSVPVANAEKSLAHEPSLGFRLGHTALLVAAGSVAALTAPLWLTEPSLPLRTHSAFGAIVIVGASWAAYAGWALTNGRGRPANHRGLALWLAAASSALLLLGAQILKA